MNYRVERRVNRLKEYTRTFHTASAVSFGAAFGAGIFTYETHPSVLTFSILFLFFIWCGYQSGNHIKTIKSELSDLERNDDPSREEFYTNMLEFGLEQPIWRIILP